jgi:hypothetical protein
VKPDEHTENVVKEIHQERIRQIHDEWWSTRHDDKHTDGELAAAAAYYAAPEGTPEGADRDRLWPYSSWGECPKGHPPRRRLVIAAALIVAEIERLDRIK